MFCYLHCSSNSHKITSNCFWITWKLKSVHFSIVACRNKHVPCMRCGKPCRSFKTQTFWSPIYPLLHMMIVYLPHKRFILCYIYKCLVSFPHTFFGFIIFLSLYFYFFPPSPFSIELSETKLILFKQKSLAKYTEIEEECENKIREKHKSNSYTRGDFHWQRLTK